MEKLIRALRCSATGHWGVFKCEEDCPYRVIEEVNPDLPVPPDVITNGVGYWTGCDYDRIALDAAEALEKQILKKPVLDLSKSLRDRCPSCGSVIFTLYEDETKFPHCQWCGQKLDWGE